MAAPSLPAPCRDPREPAGTSMNRSANWPPLNEVMLRGKQAPRQRRPSSKLCPLCLGSPPPARGRLPLSGNVTQSINPWTWLFNPVGSQIGLVNIELGQSSNPAVEEEVLSDVASYGKQLGRIEDALLVLLAHFHSERKLIAAEEKALGDLKSIATDVAAVKAKHRQRSAS